MPPCALHERYGRVSGGLYMGWDAGKIPSVKIVHIQSREKVYYTIVVGKGKADSIRKSDIKCFF